MNTETFRKQLSEALDKNDGHKTAREILDTALPSLAENAEKATLYFEYGRLLWKRGEKGAAISAYESATLLDPESPASAALDIAREVMDFYHRDLYNP